MHDDGYSVKYLSQCVLTKCCMLSMVDMSSRCRESASATAASGTGGAAASGAFAQGTDDIPDGRGRRNSGERVVTPQKLGDEGDRACVWLVGVSERRV